MAEINGLEASEIQNNVENEGKDDKNLSVGSTMDISRRSDDESISIDTADLKSISKALIKSESNRKLLLPLLNTDSLSQDDAWANKVHHLRGTHNMDPETPTVIMEASDPFLNPDLYTRYSICTAIEDTFHERLAKQMEIIKDVTREKAINSITAGENSVYWLVNSFKYLTSGWFGLVILLLTICAYGSIGAFIFMWLESSNEKEHKELIVDLRRDFANKIENIVKNETIMKNNSAFVTLIQDSLKNYENSYNEYMKHLVSSNVTWDFWNSFIFAGTIFTTIGYGHISPKTSSGRVATIVYAIIGIPLFLTVLTSFGKFLTRIIKFFWAHLVCSRNILKAKRKAPIQAAKDSNAVAVYRPSLIEDKYKEETLPQIKMENDTKSDLPEPAAIEIDEDFNLPISLAIAILLIYMLFGAIVTHITEDWPFLDAFYFVFISMSTIGLGDLVASDPFHMIYSILYIIFGLSLTAMCIEVIQRNLTIMFKNACKKFLLMIEESDCSMESTAVQS